MSFDIPYSDQTEDIMEDDDSDIIDDKELEYDEFSWPKNAEEPTGFRYKGKKQCFVRAVENITIFMKKKGTTHQMELLQFTILDSRKFTHGIETDVDITKDNSRGQAVLKIYGPNSKKECTVLVTKKQKHDAKYAKILATEIVKPLIDSFTSGIGWNKLVRKVAAKPPVKPFTCKICGKGFLSGKTLNTHVEKTHKPKEINCDLCDYVTIDQSLLEVHIEDQHNESEEKEPMDVGSDTDLDDVIQLSRMRDNKILEKEKNLKKEELKAEERKKSERQKQIAAEKLITEKKKLEKKRKKNQQKSIKKSSKKTKKYPPNISSVPQNIKHLVTNQSLQFQVNPDGACAANCGAAHIFQDAKEGPRLRMLMNNHMVSLWKQFYSKKISFPYLRQVGVSGKKVRFEEGEEEKFLLFLKTEEAAFLWSDSEDLQIMSNLYQMTIKTITTKGDNDDYPTVNYIGPDEQLNDYKMLRAGIVPEMTLIHYENLHYNLVIDKESRLVKVGNLFEEPKVLDMSIDDSQNDDEDKDSTEAHSEQKVRELLNENEKNRKLIKTLRDQIDFLEKKGAVKNHCHDNHGVLNDKYGDQAKIASKKNDFTQENPQYEPEAMDSKSSFQCKVCDLEFESLQKLKTHEQTHFHKCEQCEKGFSSQSQLNTHVTTLHVEYECDLCEDVFSSQSELNEHMTTLHIEYSLPYKCGRCEERFSTKSNLNVHLNKKHKVKQAREEQSNCYNCNYQGHDKNDLKKHIENTHHSQSEKSFHCHSCGKTFDSKSDLMYHRKAEHYDIIKKCSYYIKNECIFDAVECWYPHDSQDTVNANSQQENKCKLCGKTFDSKPEFMIHRKLNHNKMVSKCRDFKKGTCINNNEDCWYKHEALDKTNEKKDEGNSPNSVFRNVQENMHPPDMMKRMWDTIQQIMKKVDFLEKETKKKE